MATRSYILVVNGRKVRQPVFVIGAPHSGADLLGRALKRSEGFHFTIGQPSVVNVVYAFARTPSIQQGRGEAAVTVLRDAFAQAWRVTPEACLTCHAECQQARAGKEPGICVDEREIARYGDATPALMYCAEALVDAFPDAKIVQIIRDGRDVVAAMMSDPAELAWFRGGIANVEAEFPNPFYGTETEADRDGWQNLTAAGKCAMRWRGSVHKLARLRNSLSADQLTTFRYEQMVAEPQGTAAALSEFVEARVGLIDAGQHGKEINSWRRLLSPAQLAEVERVAGQQLRRVGYGN
ncbi:MAG TPA: sulfotransferase [Streptosporangiaceae bacterium]|nr:sulfotransferase [Streptosporangiaceae bacterium]